jgi:probable phosphoglycerate mutase
MRVGEADGLPNREAWARYGVPNIDQDAFHQISPGGESWAQFMLRVGTTLNRITHQHAGKTIVIICHGGVIDGSFIYFFGLSSLQPPQTGLYTHNTSITHWRQYQTRHGQQRWRLMSYNDSFHLRHVGINESLDWRDISAADHGVDRSTVPLPTEEQQDEE